MAETLIREVPVMSIGATQLSSSLPSLSITSLIGEEEMVMARLTLLSLLATLLLACSNRVASCPWKWEGGF